MENRVKSFLKINNIVIDKPIICAVSGGVDSVCMITILYKLGYNVILAHVNHNKRKESILEQEEMYKLAKKLNIPFELLDYHYDGKDNFHNDSHNARYGFFKDLCNKYNTNIISTAHHLNDQIETILIKLMEGSNLYGYGGISICNDDGQFKIIRPLLCTNKEELYLYAKENDLVFFEDSSNNEDEFVRNRIRHHIIPLLKNECNDLYNKTLQYSNQLKEAFNYIRSQSIEYLDKTNNIISFDSFNKLNVALKKDIISLLLERYNINKSYSLINNIVEFLSSEDGSKNIVLANDYILIREYNMSYITKRNIRDIKKQSITLENSIIFDNKYKFYFSKKVPSNNAKYIKLCYNEIVLPFYVKTKEDGDNIELLIGNKKVSRIFIDNKIPVEKRNYIPIITDNNGKILWIYNLAKSKDVFKQKNSNDILYFVCEEINNAKRD